MGSRLHALWRHGRNVAIDMRYGKRIGGPGKPKPQRYRELGAYSFTNSDYASLAQMFRGRTVPEDVLVDVGSGRGRVLNYWLHTGHRGPIYGLELDEEYAATSARRLARWHNVHVIQGDAVDNLPAEATCLYMFNPFDRCTMCRLRDALLRKLHDIRRLRIVYYAPTCLDVWTDDPRWHVEVHEIDLWGVLRYAERHRIFAVITAGRV